MYMKKFIKERNEALLSLDKQKILAYFDKYEIERIEGEELFWLTIHKSILGIEGITKEQRERSVKWLTDRGYKAW